MEDPQEPALAVFHARRHQPGRSDLASVCALPGLIECFVYLSGLAVGKLLKFLPEAHHTVRMALFNFRTVGSLYLVQT
jgi:hypothetical protein